MYVRVFNINAPKTKPHLREGGEEGRREKEGGREIVRAREKVCDFNINAPNTKPHLRESDSE